MAKAEGYVGTLSITWENGDKNIFQISQKQGRIWVGEHLVSINNERSFQGVLHEIADVMSYPPQKVRQYTWLELVGKIEYP